METILKLGDLERWVRNLGIENLVERKFAKALNPDGTPKDKTGKREYIQALQRHFLSSEYPSGVPRHLELALSTYPQMAARQNQLKPERLKEILDSPDWVCEEKIQGFRTRLVYVRDEGCFWYSRYLSDANMLPRSVPLPSPEILSSEIMNFVLDGEVIAKDPQGLVRDLRESKIILDNEQEATTYVLSNFNPHDIVPGAVFVFNAIDALELNFTPLVNRELGDRKYLLSLLMRNLREASGIDILELPSS
jgi:ATP-dependent DNA ligase